MSKRDAPVAIISIAQQASPNVMGQSADFRDQLKTKSTVVVMMPLDDSTISSLSFAIESFPSQSAIRNPQFAILPYAHSSAPLRHA
jgi:hypothetical protein